MAGIEEARKKLQQGKELFEQSGSTSIEGGQKLEGAADALILAHSGILGVLENLKQARTFFSEAVAPVYATATKAEDANRLLKDATQPGVQDVRDSQSLQNIEATAQGLRAVSNNVNRASMEGAADMIGSLASMAEQLEQGAAYWMAQQELIKDTYPNQALPTITGFIQQRHDSL